MDKSTGDVRSARPSLVFSSERGAVSFNYRLTPLNLFFTLYKDKVLKRIVSHRHIVVPVRSIAGERLHTKVVAGGVIFAGHMSGER